MSTTIAPIDWLHLRVHPAAQTLPMMGNDELRELAEDIERNGLQEQLVLWCDNRDAANGAKAPFPRYLLDGRNRLAALWSLGITDPKRAPSGRENRVRVVYAMKQIGAVGRSSTRTAWVPDVDPYSFVVSLNVHRRHLTAEQKRAAIADHVKLDPDASDRKIAKKVGVDHKTVAKTRTDLEGRGEIPHVEQRTDTKGRKQPARKPKPKPEPKPVEQPVAESKPGAFSVANTVGARFRLVDAQLDEVLDSLATLDDDARAELVAEHKAIISSIGRRARKIAAYRS